MSVAHRVLCGAFFLFALTASAQQYTYVRSVPETHDARVKEPSGIAFSRDGKLYLADRETATVFVYDSLGAPAESISQVQVNGAGVHLKRPVSVFVNSAGDVYIADEGLNKIAVVKPDGTGILVGTEEGSGIGRLSGIRGLAVNSHGTIFVLCGSKRVEVFSADGHYRTWLSGGAESFHKPIAIGINGANDLYVLDASGPTVSVFDVAGNFIGANQHRESAAGVSIDEPSDIAVFRNGDYCIIDRDNCRMTSFRRGGQSIGTIGTKGSSMRGVFAKASNLAAGMMGTSVIGILDKENGQVQIFRMPAGPVDLNSAATPPAMTRVDAKSAAFIDLAYSSSDWRYRIPVDNQEVVEAGPDSLPLPSYQFPMKRAVSLATDDSGNVFVLDSKTQEVSCFDKNGVLVRRFGQEINDHLKDAQGIATSSDGSVLVADRSTQTVKRWTNGGVFDRTLCVALSNVMESPYKVRVDSKDNIYVWDDNLNAIVRFKKDGTLLGARTLKLRSKEAGESKGKIGGFEMDAYDQLHLFNSTTNEYSVYKWEDFPEILFTYGRPGEQCDGCFDEVKRIGIDTRTFTAYIVTGEKANSLVAYRLPFVDFLGDANRLFDQGKIEEAMTTYTVALKRLGSRQALKAKIARRFTVLTNKLLAEFQPDRALTYARFASTLQPTDMAVRSTLAQCYGAVANAQALGENYRELLATVNAMVIGESPRLAPYVLPRFDTIAAACMQRRDEAPLRAAIGIYQRLSQWDSSGRMFHLLSSAGMSMYRFKKSTGAPEVELAVQLGSCEANARKSDKLLSPKDKEYYANRALLTEISVGMRSYDAAVQIASTELQKEGVSLPKEYVPLLRQQLAEAYAGQGKPELAEGEYKRLVALDPNNKEYKLLLGSGYMLSKHFDDALSLYQGLLNEDRGNARYMGEIGKVMLAKKEFAEASFQLEKAIQTDHNRRDLYGPLAEAFDGDGKSQQALLNYDLATDYARNQFAYARSHGVGPDESSRLQKQIARYLCAGAQLHYQLGDAATSIPDFKEVTVLDQTNALGWFGLGKAYLATGVVYDAVEALRRAQSIDQSSAEINSALASATALRDQMRQSAGPVEISRFGIDDLFPSLYRNYSNVRVLPIGELVLTNNLAVPLAGVKVEIQVERLTDGATPQQVPTLVGLSNSTIRLSAVFRETILQNTEDSKYQATVTVKFTHEGKEKTLTKSATFVLHGRNAVSWKDKRRLAAFISPSTEALINYSKEIDVRLREAPMYPSYRTILQAAAIFSALSKSEFTYSPDPNVNYAKASVQTDILDYVQYPAETIMRRSGDCDDLVAVYCGLLEAAGIGTAYVDVPGHVFMAFDTGIDTALFEGSGLDQRDIVISNGKVWLPVETTLLGKTGFMAAWKYASEHYYQYIANRQFPEIVSFADARKVYEPSTFVPAAFQPRIPQKEVLVTTYSEAVFGLVEKTTSSIRKELELRRQSEPDNVFVRNKLAILYVRAGQLDKAETVIKEALELSSNSSSAHNTYGNVFFARREFSKAANEYVSALEFDRSDADLFVNLCRAQIALGEKADARRSFESAVQLRPIISETHAFLKESIEK
jgi:tetratricopeptide (TPR) repeat protein/DNA-binding beta-propeller fold protein YncE